jgi:TRAP-type uncharacterized transport system substrate-binding protein
VYNRLANLSRIRIVTRLGSQPTGARNGRATSSVFAGRSYEMRTDKHPEAGIMNHRLAPWSKLFALFGLTVLIILAGWLAFALLPSVPQRSVVMAMYPEGSLSAELARHYQGILVRKGINLELKASAGAVESVALLKNPKSGITIALVPGGITTEEESPELVSLGTLFYQPLWVFSNRHLRQDHEEFLRVHMPLRISIGPEGSSSRTLSLTLLGRAGVIDRKSDILLPYTPSESAQKLIRGEIDVAIFLDGWESPSVQQLLHAKDVSLESILRADAFVALYPYLSKLVLPAGAVDMVTPKPPSDVLLIAPKSSLVVREDLDPAIQYMLLEAAAEIHSTPGMFRDVNQFPAPEPIDLPLSSYAQQFYKTGTPFLLRHLPFWLAVLLAQPVVWLIPALVILFPVFRLAPAMYDWFEKRRVYMLYSELRQVEEEMSGPASGQGREDFLERLDRLNDRASRLSVPTPFKPLVYSLRLHIDMVRKEAEREQVKPKLERS